MSNTYKDLTETQFPDQIDELTRMSDLSSSDIPAVNEYYSYYNAGNLTAAAELLANNPSLMSKLFNAAKFNVLHDALIAMQRYYKMDIHTFIEKTRGTLEKEVEQFTVMGDYDPNTTYHLFNVVTFDGGSYICKQPELTGVAPTFEKTDANWGLLAARGPQGLQGASGTGLSWRGMYSAETDYYADDCVTDGFCLFAALKDSKGKDLDDTEYWSRAIAAGSTHTPVELVLPHGSWSGNKLTVGVSTVRENSTIIVSASDKSAQDYHTCGVQAVEQANGSMIFSCETVPTMDLFANIIIFNN